MIAGDRSTCKSKQGGSTEQYYSAAIITGLLNVHTIQTAPAEFVCMYSIRKTHCKHPSENLFPYWF